MNATPQELASLYISGAMTRSERDAVEAKVAAGDAELIGALAELRPTGDGLADLIEPIEPSASVRDAVLRDAQAGGQPRQVWQEWDAQQETSSLYTLPADAGEWEETGVPGITVRRLFIDRANNRMTAMFKMAPGAAYVPHVHDGPEECYVLEGDLHVDDDIVMHAGDYQRAPAGSTHGVQRTEGGCTLLIVSSMDDELI